MKKSLLFTPGLLFVAIYTIAICSRSFGSPIEEPPSSGRVLRGTVTLADGTAPDQFYVATPETGPMLFRWTGKFELEIPEGKTPTCIFAWRGGAGFDYRMLLNEKNRETERGNPFYAAPEKPIALSLNGITPLILRAVDTDGRGIQGVEFSLYGIAGPPRLVGNELIIAPSISWPIPFWTDDQGTAVLAEFPAWARGQLGIRPKDGFGDYVRTCEPELRVGGQETVFVQEFIRRVPVSGTVRDSDGKPVADLKITATGTGPCLSDRTTTATTDQQGRYTVFLPPYQWYLMSAPATEDWAFPAQDDFAILPGKPVEHFDITMEPATMITLKFVGDPDKQRSYANRKVGVNILGKNEHDVRRVGNEPVPKGFRVPIYRGMQCYSFPTNAVGRFRTDENGCLTIPVGSGRYTVRLEDAREHDPFGDDHEFEVKYDPGHRERTVEIPVQTEETSVFCGTVLTRDAAGNWEPAPRREVLLRTAPAAYSGTNSRDIRFWPYPQTDADGRFEFERLNNVLRICVCDAVARQGIHAIVPGNQREITLKLRPLVSVTGRIVNLETGEPLAGAEVEYRLRYESVSHVSCGQNLMDGINNKPFCDTITTDSDGRFAIDDLLPDETYDFHYIKEKNDDGGAEYWQIGGFRTTIAETQTEPPTLDVGEIRVATPRPVGMLRKRPTGIDFDIDNLADNLSQARTESDPGYAWFRVERYKSVILALLELGQNDAAKSVTKEMLDVVDSSREARKDKPDEFLDTQIDWHLYEIATALKAKGENETAAEIRKHFKTLNESKIVRRKYQNGVKSLDEFDALLKEIDDTFEGWPKGDAYFDLFLNGGRWQFSIPELAERVRQMKDAGTRIRLLSLLAGDARDQGNAEQEKELIDEAISLLKKIPTPQEQSSYWDHQLLSAVRRSGDRELLHQIAVQKYENRLKAKLPPLTGKPEVTIMPNGGISPEDKKKLSRYAWSTFVELSHQASPLEILVQTGEQEKALRLVERIVAYKNCLTKEELAVCGVRGSLESALARCADTYALCGRTEEAKQLWSHVLDLLDIGDAEHRSGTLWPTVSGVRSDLFKDDVRKLCLDSVESMKTYVNERRPEDSLHRCVTHTASMGFVLARAGFTDDAKRVLDDLLTMVEKEGSDDYFLSHVAQGYANAHFPEQAKEVAEKIQAEKTRNRVLRSITLPWDWWKINEIGVIP